MVAISFFRIGFSAKPVQAQASGVTLQFKKDLVKKENEIYALPLHLNTGGQVVSAVEIKINSTGNVDLLGLQVSGVMDNQEVFSYVKDDGVYLSFTATNIQSGMSNNQDQEVALLKFITLDDEPIVFVIDQDKTMVVSAVTDDNILFNFDSLTFTGELSINEPIDDSVDQEIGQNNPTEAVQAMEMETIVEPEENGVATNNTQIIVAIVALVSIIGVIGGLLLFFRSKNQENLQTNVSLPTPDTETNTQQSPIPDQTTLQNSIPEPPSEIS